MTLQVGEGVEDQLLGVAVWVVGLGLGPFSVAVFTDFVFDDESRLYQSLASVSAIAVPLSGLILFLSLKHYRKSVERAKTLL